MNGKTENGEVVRVKFGRLLFSSIAIAIMLAIISGAWDIYKSASEGPRYTQGEADADNPKHNRRLCAVEQEVFGRTMGECG